MAAVIMALGMSLWYNRKIYFQFCYKILELKKKQFCDEQSHRHSEPLIWSCSSKKPDL